MIKNIIFDWTGVVKDSVGDHLLIVNKMFEIFGIENISLDELKENWEQPYMRFYNKYLPSLTLEEEQVLYNKLIVSSPKGKPFPGIVEIIKEFNLRGIKMFVLSSDHPDTLLPEMESFGLKNVFVEIIAGVYNKSESLGKLIKKHELSYEETVFIGDSNHEIEESKQAGVQSIAVTWGFSSKESLSILKPDYIVTSVEELKSVVLTS